MDERIISYQEKRKIVREIRQYLGSPKGRRELTEALERADDSCERMRKASRVRLEDLYTPIDI